MNVKEYVDLILGINRIVYEVNHNHHAFYAIWHNENFDIEKPIPTSLMMLLKNHYQVYIIELSKIILPGQNHFHINIVLNAISENEKFKEKAKSIKKSLNNKKRSIQNIKMARNMIFAHTDKNFLDYKNSMTEKESDELLECLKDAVDFLNDTIKLDNGNNFRNMKDPKIFDFYNLIFQEIINSGKSDKLPNEDPNILYQ